jgi:arylformamidase
MDAPLHFIRDGAGLDTMPFSATIGPARVIQIADTESIKPGELEPHCITEGERILFKTSNSPTAWLHDSFFEDFVYISREAAAFLVKCGVQTVGVDYLSVGGFKKDGVETHQILLEAGIWLIEGLDLSQVNPGMYDLICLPIRILGSDGAPARAIIRKLSPA